MVVMKNFPQSFLPVYRPAPGWPVPLWLQEVQVALLLGKIRVVPEEQVDAERGGGYHYAGEHGRICFACRRIGGSDSFDFELVSIAAATGKAGLLGGDGLWLVRTLVEDGSALARMEDALGGERRWGPRIVIRAPSPPQPVHAPVRVSECISSAAGTSAPAMSRISKVNFPHYRAAFRNDMSWIDPAYDRPWRAWRQCRPGRGSLAWRQRNPQDTGSGTAAGTRGCADASRSATRMALTGATGC